jgi:hypothetical protein
MHKPSPLVSRTIDHSLSSYQREGLGLTSVVPAAGHHHATSVVVGSDDRHLMCLACACNHARHRRLSQEVHSYRIYRAATVLDDV